MMILNNNTPNLPAPSPISAQQTMLLQSQLITVPLYRSFNPGRNDDFYTISAAEYNLSLNIGYVPRSIAGQVLSTQAPNTVPLYRYFHGGIVDHFYTTNFNALGFGNFGWFFERIECYVYPFPQPGTVPFYRFWNLRRGNHAYTINFSEFDNNRRWIYEGIEGYIFP